MKIRLSLFLLAILTLNPCHSAPLRKSLCPNVLKPNPEARAQAPEIYVRGEGSSQPGHIMVLSSSQYEKLAIEEKIPPNVILVLDEIPLNVDPPVVQAILVAKPISLRRTHVETLAEKLSMPFAFVPGLFHLPIFSQGFSPRGLFRVVIGEGKGSETIQLVPSTESDRSPIVPSVLPEYLDRSFAELIGPYQYDQFPLGVVGSKFYSLARLARKLPDNTPVPFSVSSGYFEEFLDKAVYGSVVLREYLRRQRTLLEREGDPTKQKRILTKLRAAIKDAQLPGGNDLFVRISDKLNFSFGLYSRISVRSNNAEEDLIASGAYQSAVAENATSIELSKAFRKVWASLYSFRAYQIRKLRGQREENLSMPLLVHKYVDGEVASGVGRFQMTHGLLHFDADVTIGAESKATNPLRSSENISVRVYKDSNGEIQADKVHENMNSPEGDILIHQLKELFQLMEQSVIDSYKNRLYPPIHIDIEYVFVRRRKIDPTSVPLKPVVLQFKEVMSQEIVHDVLTGKIKRSDLERQIVLGDLRASSGPEGQFLDYGLFTFANMPYLKGSFYRYALFRKGTEPLMVIWADGRDHESVKVALTEKLGFAWAWGGYLDIKGHEFVFSTTSQQPRMHIPDLGAFKDLFLRALAAGVTQHSGLRGVLLHGEYSLVLPSAFSDSAVSSEQFSKFLNNN